MLGLGHVYFYFRQCLTHSLLSLALLWDLSKFSIRCFSPDPTVSYPIESILCLALLLDTCPFQLCCLYYRPRLYLLLCSSPEKIKKNHGSREEEFWIWPWPWRLVADVFVLGLGLGVGLGRKVMDGGDGWRMIKYAGGAHDKTIINRIMLRFRPIVPKPTTGGSFSGGSALHEENAVLSRRRTKRKYVRVRGCSKGKGRATVAGEEIRQTSMVTLQLLPMNCTEENDTSTCGSWCNSFDRTTQVRQDQDDENALIRLDLMSRNTGLTVDARPLNLTAVKTWVTVEYVSDTCMDTRGLGCTDLEKMTNLECDACPGFISDGSNRVLWVNKAFRKMVKSDEEVLGESPEKEVWLVVKERLLPCMVALTCQVKVEYRWPKEKWRQMVPCDAWRMDGGGYAWRLDVKAALRLGR